MLNGEVHEDDREELSALDAELAAMASAESALRLRLGQVLEVLGRGGHFELGFSSLGAYALERCERSVRWVEGARCLARRLEALPELRQALALGGVSWSMAELIARVASAEDESSWVAAAEQRTVREIRAWVRQVSSRTGRRDDDRQMDDSANDDEPTCVLTCTVAREDAWLFEATRKLLGQLGTQGQAEQIEALLAEGQDTLLGALPRGSIDADALEQAEATSRHRSAELEQLRYREEVAREDGIRAPRQRAEAALMGGAAAAASGYAALTGMGSVALDEMVQELSRLLSGHELELSMRILRLHREDGWRRLGYATEAQYAREQLGMSRSSMLAKRALALKLERLPGLVEALRSGQLGVEAAVQVARVATARTEAAWVERARQRTVKHLREEVEAAAVAVRVSGNRDCPPPSDAELSGFHDLERAVVQGGGRDSGARGDGSTERGPLHSGVNGARRAWSVMLTSLSAWLARGLLAGGVRMYAGAEAGVQTSAGGEARPPREVASAGRIALRFRVSRATYVWWRWLEAAAQRWLPPGMGWLRFLCLSLWRAWRHVLGRDVAYAHIYDRDRWRCTSPVCNRRDVTPHHLQFRSAGGSDEDGNVATVCSWCHLFGVHEGRIRAVGTARRIDWELGPRDRPCVVVHGRQRVAA